MAAPNQAGCDSCLFKVQSLDKPYDLSGKWLFSRQDNPQNKDVNLDTSNWELINAPGPWFWVEPGKTFLVGWYRGVFEFPPEMIGQKVVVLMDTYLSRTDIYLDGELLFRRPDPDRFQPFYPIQPMPASFTITKTRHVFSFRIQSFMMTGPYQLPLKLQKFDEAAQRSMATSQVWAGGGLIRSLAAYVGLGFGAFFYLVYFKTKGSMYKLASLVSVSMFPFFAFPNENFVRSWGPEVAYFLHYIGLFVAYYAMLFFQYFTGWQRTLNRVLGIACLFSTALFFFIAFVYRDATLMLAARYLCIGLAFTCLGFGAYPLFIKAYQNPKDSNLRVLSGATLITAALCANDGGIDFGLYASYGTISIGLLLLVVAILWVASVNFANTFLENRQLAKDLKVINENLEDLVSERTAQLRQKTADITAMMENMPQGVLTVLADNTIHPEYSAYLETIFETKEIAGQAMMELLFTDSSVGSDMLSQVDAAASSCIGEDRMNFDFNSHLLIAEFDKKMPDGNTKSLELSWSPICNEEDTVEKLMICVRDVTELKRLAGEADEQRRELEMIGQILAVSQEKFHEFIESAYKFIAENEELIQRTPQRDTNVIGLLFRNMHTIKGNARTYGLKNMTNIVHETEQVYDDMRKDAELPWEPQALLEQLAQVRVLVDKYSNINVNTLGRKGPGRRGSVERFLLADKSQVEDSLQIIKSVDKTDMAALNAALLQVSNTLCQIGTEPLKQVVSGIVESLPSLANELGKETPTVTIKDNGIVIRNQVTGLLKNLLMHVARNSMDHGLEDTATRVAKGKTPEGHIELELTLEGEEMKLKLRDDGRGLAVARIRKIALEKELLTQEQAASPEIVAQAIFISGFSTAEAVTEVSGRGVGMDAVKGFLQSEGGDVQILFLDENSDADFRPFELVMSLPAKFGVQTQV